MNIEKLGFENYHFDVKEFCGELSIFNSIGLEIVKFDSVCTNEEEDKRNSLLFSAAPEMLEALIDFVKTHSHGEIWPIHKCDCMGCRGRKAIEKATGKTWEEIKEIIK